MKSSSERKEAFFELSKILFTYSTNTCNFVSHLEGIKAICVSHFPQKKSFVHSGRWGDSATRLRLLLRQFTLTWYPSSVWWIFDPSSYSLHGSTQVNWIRTALSEWRFIWVLILEFSVGLVRHKLSSRDLWTAECDCAQARGIPNLRCHLLEVISFWDEGQESSMRSQLPGLVVNFT